MEITDEIIGCYIEGTATLEERIRVREYLCSHPEENERILCLIDKDTADFPEEHVEEEYSAANDSFSDMDCCVAAFAPVACKGFQPQGYNAHKEKISGRLSVLWNELAL